MFPTSTQQGVWVFLNLTKTMLADLREKLPPAEREKVDAWTQAYADLWKAAELEQEQSKAGCG